MEHEKQVNQLLEFGKDASYIHKFVHLQFNHIFLPRH
jgi:hypothetical protein